ncbi:GNAT family N-acetyltransferase [Roseomonas sp. BN140053]|uniref:GNAT family N-acetyltransferase n=1 Tax=Roseomonas sp. BN140053 TaxID=3391898 RepID=UPI0039EA9234
MGGFAGEAAPRDAAGGVMPAGDATLGEGRTAAQAGAAVEGGTAMADGGRMPGGSSVTLRAATAADVPALAAVAERGYRAGFAGILDAAVLDMQDRAGFAHRFAAAWPRLAVAEMDGSLAGFCLVSPPRLDMLFVDPGFTRRGLGAALLRQAEAMGARELECFRDNAAALGFYARQGWHPLSAHRRDFLGAGRDFLILARQGAQDISAPNSRWPSASQASLSQ